MPSTPSPPSVGTPSAAVKLPSEPPPVFRSCRSMPASAAHLRACSNRAAIPRSEEHTSELQSLMRISYAVFCLKNKKQKHLQPNTSVMLQGNSPDHRHQQ